MKIWTLFSLFTEPCPPTNVSAEVLCESDEMKISWQEASGAESFLVTVSGSDGLVKIYSTNQTLLRASLPCGQDFNVTVRGQGSMCNGIPSSPTFFKTGGTFSTSYANYFNVYVLTVLFSFLGHSSMYTKGFGNWRRVWVWRGLRQLAANWWSWNIHCCSHWPRRPHSPLHKQYRLLHLERPALWGGVQCCSESKEQQLHQSAEQQLNHPHGYDIDKWKQSEMKSEYIISCL